MAKRPITTQKMKQEPVSKRPDVGDVDDRVTATRAPVPDGKGARPAEQDGSTISLKGEPAKATVKSEPKPEIDDRFREPVAPKDTAATGQVAVKLDEGKGQTKAEEAERGQNTTVDPDSTGPASTAPTAVEQAFLQQQGQVSGGGGQGATLAGALGERSNRGDVFAEAQETIDEARGGGLEGASSLLGGDPDGSAETLDDFGGNAEISARPGLQANEGHSVVQAIKRHITANEGAPKKPSTDGKREGDFGIGTVEVKHEPDGGTTVTNTDAIGGKVITRTKADGDVTEETIDKDGNTSGEKSMFKTDFFEQPDEENVGPRQIVTGNAEVDEMLSLEATRARLAPKGGGGDGTTDPADSGGFNSTVVAGPIADTKGTLLGGDEGGGLGESGGASRTLVVGNTSGNIDFLDTDPSTAPRDDGRVGDALGGGDGLGIEDAPNQPQEEEEEPPPDPVKLTSGDGVTVSSADSTAEGSGGSDDTDDA